mmetsp:Transcript_44879/g.54350  ORF Transcript_44879/g.54350 Transcript_44879/m.54350 type:complete len:1344 (+) Transcript_44879:57-4088(+)|eukprot:CAMPEP_0172502336 /NCGR_PEP_ID=MMETSP1066-20121228/158880_1 /TAXON_ID=671091 /ORGANISM="Coscinodiscus wailesii, Strain CCMP2513" /LENGTH=1343 /DNA_ID=CAMNT_0013277549 /DNA_START=48 /DNA_END=4079 /DNA_ORIENTATION=+
METTHEPIFDHTVSSYYTIEPSEERRPPPQLFQRVSEMRSSEVSEALPSDTDVSKADLSVETTEFDFRTRLFAKLDQQITCEKAQICLVCCIIFNRSFPDLKKVATPSIPTTILYSFWREVVQDVDPKEVVEKLDFFSTQIVSLKEKEVECIKLQEDIYQEYIQHVFTKLMDKLKHFGNTKDEIIRKLNLMFVNLLENNEEHPFETYAMLLLPSNISAYDTQRALKLLSDQTFISQRLRVLDIPTATAAHVSDCESLPESLPGAYTMLSSQMEEFASNSQNPMESRVQVGRGYLSLANSLQNKNLNGLSLYFDALSKFECVLNHTCTGSLLPIPNTLLELSQMDMAETLHQLGKLCGQMEYYHRELQIERPLLGKHHPRVADTLHCIGVLHLNQNELEDALSHFQEALRVRRLAARDVTSHAGTELKIAQTLECEGIVLEKMEQFEEAKESLKEALMLRGVYMASDCEEIASLHHRIGCVEEELGLYAASLAQFGEALRIRRMSCCESILERENVAETLCCMARIYQERGEMGYAIECFREAVDHKKYAVMNKVKWMREWYKRESARTIPMPFVHGGRQKKWTISLNMVYEDVWGDVTEEEKKDVAALLRIMVNIVDLSIDQQGKDNLFVSNSFQSMGEVYIKIGFCNKAIKCLEQACQIRQTLGIDDEVMALAAHQLGICHSKLGRYQSAIEELERSLDIWETVDGRDPKIIADLWYDIGNAQCAIGSHSALRSLTNASTLRGKLDPPDELEMLNVQHCLGVAHTHLSNYAEAREIFEANLENNRQILGSDHIYVAHALYYLGQVYQMLNLDSPSLELLQKSLDNYEMALAIYRKQLKETDLVIAHVHHSLGTIWNLKEDHVIAKKYFDLALKTYKTFNDGENLLVATVLNHLGVIFTLQDEDFKSMMCLQESLRIRVKLLGSNHSTLADTLHNIGGVHAKFERFREAMRCYEKALSIRVECYGDDDPSVAKVLNNLGILHARVGDYKMARQRLKAALKIQHMWEDETESIASSLYNLGNVLARTDKFDSAARCYEESLSIRRNLYGDNHPTIGNMMHNLGVLCEQRDDNARAKHWYDESLKIKRKLLGPESLAIATTLAKVGDLQKREGDYEGALRCYQRVLKVQKRHYGPDHADVAETLMSVGGVNKVTGVLDIAFMSVEEALRIREEVFGEQHIEVAKSLYLLGTINELMEEQEDAFLCYGNAYRIYRTRRRKAKNDHDRQRVASSLRKIISKMNGNAGFCDTLIITGDCWLSVENCVLDFVKHMQSYVMEPTSKMVHDVVASSLKDSSKPMNDDGGVPGLEASSDSSDSSPVTPMPRSTKEQNRYNVSFAGTEGYEVY